jgi:predicted dehydrogenase
MPEKVFIASGHITNFVDPVAKCKKCGTQHRADHILEDFLKRNFEGITAEDLTKIIKDKKIDAVIIATWNSAAAKLCLEAIRHKKNVLCEKPMGINYQEARKIYTAAKKNGVTLKAGFNHRFHNAVKKAHALVKSGAIGELMYMRAVYGQGGRKGYDLEWRMKKKLSGGGELLDQGVHLLDLFRWFMGEFKEGVAFCENMFWDKTKLEDNAFCTLRTRDGKVAQMQVSITQWKNKFSIDIFGKKGYISIEGKGGSYGQEKLLIGRRKELGVKPTEEEFLFDKDTSWEEEWKNFRNAVAKKIQPIGNGYDGMMANKLVTDLYVSSKKKKVITF